MKRTLTILVTILMAIIFVFMVIGYALAGDVTGRWVDVNGTHTILTADINTAFRDTTTAVTSLLDCRLVRYHYAIKVDSAFAGDTLITQFLMAYDDDGTLFTPVIIEADTDGSPSTTWEWQTSQDALKIDSLARVWGGYLIVRLIWIGAMGATADDTTIVGNDYGYDFKSTAYLDRSD